MDLKITKHMKWFFDQCFELEPISKKECLRLLNIVHENKDTARVIDLTKELYNNKNIKFMEALAEAMKR